jgi:hypothetical protein
LLVDSKLFWVIWQALFLSLADEGNLQSTTHLNFKALFA